MDINRLYIWVCFFFCLALTAIGILIFFRVKPGSNRRSFRLLQYALIMLYTFGFYGMWSDLFFRILYNTMPTYKSLAHLSGYVTLISAPFLFIGAAMLVMWTISLLQKKPGLLILSMGFLTVSLVIVAYLAYQRLDLY